MVDIFQLYGLTPAQREAAQRIRDALPPADVARATNSARDYACFVERMRNTYGGENGIYTQWQADVLNTRTRETFVERLRRLGNAEGRPDYLQHAGEGEGFVAALARDRDQLFRSADALSSDYGGAQRIRGETMAHIAVLAITEGPEGCGSASLYQPRRVAQVRPPHMSA